jgi:thioredoxin 1
MSQTLTSQTVVLDSHNFQAEVLDFAGIVLVDFYADWCMPCRMLAPELEMVAQELKDNKFVKIAKINTEQNIELARKYDIQGIPNVIIFNKGKKQQQIVGLPRGQNGEAPRVVYKQIILETMLQTN